MPKSKKRGNDPRKGSNLEPLEAQLKRDDLAKFAQPKKSAGGQYRNGASDAGKSVSVGNSEESENVMSEKIGRKILSFAREQLQEEQSVPNACALEDGDEMEESDTEDIEVEDDCDYEQNEYGNEDEYADLGINEEDEHVLNAFINKGKSERRNLADIIMSKIKEKEEHLARQILREENQSSAADVSDESSALNAQLVEVYTSVGTWLSRYRSGKVPKAFKIIPALTNWEEILCFTHPEKWSPQAMFAATRLFTGRLNQKMAQRFFNLVLLPTIREDILQNRKLNYHLYMALKKTLFRPAAFFKGILLPLCESGDCSLREAAIIASILKKVSIPMMHSAAALIRLSNLPYSGATSLFVRVLLDKKYSLPYKAIDTILRHFVSFKQEDRLLPVLWHQSLLVFAQRYKAILTSEQKELLNPLFRKHFHNQITPEIRRELSIVKV